jgi:hypothetical protein
VSSRYAGRVIELACRSRECAPPPVGRGGSLPAQSALRSIPASVPQSPANLDYKGTFKVPSSGTLKKTFGKTVDEQVEYFGQKYGISLSYADDSTSGDWAEERYASLHGLDQMAQRYPDTFQGMEVVINRPPGFVSDVALFRWKTPEGEPTRQMTVSVGGSWLLGSNATPNQRRRLYAAAVIHETGHSLTYDAVGRDGDAMQGLAWDSQPQSVGDKLLVRGSKLESVSEYATTSIAEDIAESFTAHILGIDPPDDVGRRHVAQHIEAIAASGAARPDAIAYLYAMAGDDDDSTTASATIELACRSAECAPPPAGKGGSLPGAGKRSAKGSAKRAKSLKQVMAGIDALVDEDGAVQLTTDSPFLQTVLEQYAHEVGLRDTPPSPEVGYGMLLDMVETRLAVSEALKSADPEPAFVEVLQHAHREVAKEMGSEPRQVWRLVQEGTDDPFDPVGGPHGYQMRADSRASGTGVTSWWDWNDEADEEWPFRGKMRSATAAVVVEVEVTAKQVLGRIGDMRDAGEVLVAKSPEVVDRLMAGQFPIVSEEMRVATASAMVELACRSAECAPPPVGRGGSLPQSAGISDRVQQVAEDAKEVGSQDPRDERYDTARAFMLSREEAIARLERDVRGSGAHPTSTAMEGFRAEFDALSAVVPIGEGMVRRGTDEAQQLEAQARSALPELKSFVIAGDVNGRVVSESIEVLAQYPEEARSEIQSLVVGRWPSEDGSKPAAAWGGHADEAGPYNTLWLTPKLVGATDGEIAEGIGLLGKPADRSSEDVSIMMADPDRRHRIAIAHEMGHVLHSKAIRQEGQWNRMAGMTKAMMADPVARQVTQPGGRRRPIMTTKYGEENTAETVAESFALAALDGFDNTTDDQQAVVRQVLERALGPTDLAAVTDLQFADQSDEDDEYGQGDRMAPLTDTFQLPTE